MVWAVGEDAIDTMITHQTSKIAIQSGIAEVNRILNSEKFNAGNTINNLEKRGNTSTTSHFVAVMDNIQSGRIKSGENILFSVNASGVTLRMRSIILTTCQTGSGEFPGNQYSGRKNCPTIG